jgi:hypothetical protein
MHTTDVQPYYRVKPNSRLCTITGDDFFSGKVTDQEKHIYYEYDSNIIGILFNSSDQSENKNKLDKV